jgi:sodium/hydrogen antiporter
MREAIWFLIVGGICVAMGIASSFVKQLPLTGAMLYLAAGFALGPPGAGLLALDIARDAHLVRVVSEIALLVSLFAIGLRLRLPLTDRLWMLPLRLGVLGMVVTVAIIAFVGASVLHLAWGPALGLAAMLAPTDPVLAHDVQVRDANDLDTVPFALSGEGGLNDGIAQPFVIVALMLCASSLTDVDAMQVVEITGTMVWGLFGGIATGALLGFATTHAVTWLRTRHARALGLESFFSLGLIALSFGAAQLMHAFGFLSAFAAGVAMRRVEHRATGERTPQDAIGAIDSADLAATEAHPEKAHAYMAETVLRFTVELERIAEMTMMILVGNLLTTLPPAFYLGRRGARAHIVFCGATGRGRIVPARDARLAQGTPADELVRHPRCRHRLLPCLRPRSKPQQCGASAGAARTRHRHSVGVHAWRIGYTAHELVSPLSPTQRRMRRLDSTKIIA